MHARPWLLLCFCVLAGQARAGDAPAEAQVSALVKALRVEAIVEGTNRHRFLRDPRMQSLPESVRNCAAAADMSFFNDIYADVVREVLTPDEITEALRYYQSRAGYLNIMLSIRQGRANLEAPELLREADAAGEPSEQELRQIEAYVRSPLARKFRQIDLKARGERLPEIATPKLMKQCANQS